MRMQCRGCQRGSEWRHTLGQSNPTFRRRRHDRVSRVGVLAHRIFVKSTSLLLEKEQWRASTPTLHAYSATASAPQHRPRRSTGKIAGDPASVRRPPRMAMSDIRVPRSRGRKPAGRTLPVDFSSRSGFPRNAANHYSLAAPRVTSQYLVPACGCRSLAKGTRHVSTIAQHREEGKDERVRERCRRGTGGANLGPDGCFPAPSLTFAVYWVSAMGLGCDEAD